MFKIRFTTNISTTNFYRYGVLASTIRIFMDEEDESLFCLHQLFGENARLS